MLEHVTHLSEIEIRRPTVLAIGVFDGVHLGHQALLRQVVESAENHSTIPAVLTFYPHPREVITGHNGRLYLMQLEERVQHLAQCGIQLIITHPFDKTIRTTSAISFVDDLLAHLDLRALWGGSFSLGYQREGNFDFLSGVGQEKGFTVHLGSPVTTDDGKLVSSSRIREALQAGRVAEARACFGRNYTLSGDVVMGRQLGRTIGVPTANLQVWERQIIPANGVYATVVWVDDKPHLAATNIGVRPTVDGTQQTIEAHILDFNRDIYGATVRIEFVEHIRNEQKFAGLPALKAQIARDIEQIKMLVNLEGR